MSEMHTDPYQPEQHPVGTSPRKASGRMEYMRSVNYIFENPNWLVNLLLTLVGAIIPVVGSLVVYGYQFEIIESLHLRRHETYPDFDFNKFVDYLVRGLWVFLVTFLLGLLLVPVILIIVAIPVMLIVGSAAAGGEEAAGIGAIIGFPIMFCLIFSMVILVNMFVVPFALRAGLTQNFGASFDFGFAKQFVGNTWLEMILAALFCMVAGIVFELLSVLTCFIGLLIAIPAMLLMQAHIAYQLYEVHLAKGGDAIPLTPNQPTPPAKPVV